MGNKHFEITTLRKDISTDGRHASVLFTDDWEDDSKRRDFTFNAIYLDSNGKIFDPQSGVKDLKNKKVKFVRIPKFEEVPYPVVMEPNLVIEYYSR